MCGRFAHFSPAESSAGLFGVDISLEFEPRYNIAPTQYVAAIRPDGDGDNELAMLRWGLIPFWAKDKSIGNRMINARAETVAEKPAYRAAFRRRRCIVLADGFYEWHRSGDSKVPHYISLQDGGAFGFAALWESWKDKATDEHIESTTLITTAANDFMTPLHHRMPVILNSKSASGWLAGEDTLPGYVAPALKAWPVDRRVNNARNEGEDLIEPATPQE